VTECKGKLCFFDPRVNSGLGANTKLQICRYWWSVGLPLKQRNECIFKGLRSSFRGWKAITTPRPALRQHISCNDASMSIKDSRVHLPHVPTSPRLRLRITCLHLHIAIPSSRLLIHPLHFNPSSYAPPQNSSSNHILRLALTSGLLLLGDHTRQRLCTQWCGSAGARRWGEAEHNGHGRPKAIQVRPLVCPFQIHASFSLFLICSAPLPHRMLLVRVTVKAPMGIWDWRLEARRAVGLQFHIHRRWRCSRVGASHLTVVVTDS
jgi:hypothetical protein